MVQWIATALVFLLSFIFFWGSAPSWHFERLWRLRHGVTPPSDLMIALGLLPQERRRGSASVFFSLAALIVVVCLVFAQVDYVFFAAQISGAIALAYAAGLALHRFGPGQTRIEELFRKAGA